MSWAPTSPSVKALLRSLPSWGLLAAYAVASFYMMFEAPEDGMPLSTWLMIWLPVALLTMLLVGGWFMWVFAKHEMTLEKYDFKVSAGISLALGVLWPLAWFAAFFLTVVSFLAFSQGEKSSSPAR